MRTILLILLLVGQKDSTAQLTSFSFAEIDSLQNVEQRPVIVFIHTDWCKYCLAMKESTFKNKKVVEFISKNFWFVVLNAEENKTIVFREQSFNYIPNGSNTGIHELAKALATVDGKTTFPTTTFLDETYTIRLQLQEFLNAKNFLFVLEEMIKTLN